jgi:hypothetical protein
MMGHSRATACAIHDVAVAIGKLQQERLIERAIVVDCDMRRSTLSCANLARRRPSYVPDRTGHDRSQMWP